jgi:hypothetical protein
MMSRVIFSPTTFLADMNQRVRFLWAVSLVLLIVGVVLVGVAGSSVGSKCSTHRSEPKAPNVNLADHRYSE